MHERVRILHIDDDPEFVALTATALERERGAFSVDTATSGQEGLERLAGGRYDCIISDYEMPGMGGIEFLETVRESHPELPVILFTGEGSEEVASEAVSAGATDYLRKGAASERYELLADRIESAVATTRTAGRTALQEHLRDHAEVVAETGAWQADTETGELHCTVGTRQILGVEEGDEPATLDGVIDYAHPGERAQFREMTEQVRGSGGEATGEWRLQRADGDERLVEVSVSPVEADGEVVGLRGVMSDVTGQNERGQQPREERPFVSRALDALEELFYVVGPDGRLRRWNDTVREVTGYSDDQLAGMAVTEFVTDPDRQRLDGALEAALSGGRGTVAAELRTADGTRIPYRFAGSRLTDSNGEPTGVVGVGRRRDEYSHYPDLAGMVVRHAPDPAVLVDVTDNTTFHIEQVNPAYEELTGLEADRVCGRRPGAAFGGEFGERIDAQYRNCIEQQATVQFSEHWPVDGESHEWETSVAPVVRNGTVVALVGIKRDITSHSRRERELEQYEQLVENLPVGAFRATPGGEFVSMNERLVSMYDAGSRATLRTAGVAALYADPSHRGLLLDQLEEKGTVEDKLVRMETLDGDQLWAEVSLSTVSEDGNRYIDGVVRDVTAHDRRSPDTDAFELLGDAAMEPLFLVDVGEQLTLNHVDTGHEGAAGGGEPAASDGSEGDHSLAPSQTEVLRECIRTREARAFDGVSPLTGNPVEGTARVVPVVVDGSVEYLVGTLDRDSDDRAGRGLLRDLAELPADPDADADALLGQLLDRARQRLDVDVGLLARVDRTDGTDSWAVSRLVGDSTAVPAGPSSPLTETHCRQTLDSEGVVAVADATRAGENGDPPDGTPPAYIGATVTVDGQSWGTLSFAASEPRREPFTGRERTAVCLLARRVGAELERGRQTALFERTQAAADIGAWEYDSRTGQMHWTTGVYRVYDLPIAGDPSLERTLDRFQPGDREMVREALRAAAEDGEPFDIEGRVETAARGGRWVRVRGGPAADDPGRVRGTIQNLTGSEREQRATDGR